MTQIIMEVKNGNARMKLYGFPRFKDYCPWRDEYDWKHLTEIERQEKYARARDKHLKVQGKLVQAFVKGGRKVKCTTL